MGSYLSGSAPSRTEGSYGKVKVQPGLKWGDGLMQIIADEINRALDDLINIFKTVGTANSSDPNSHEYRLNEQEKHYPGFEEDFVFQQPGAMAESAWLDDIGATGALDNTIADAIGVGDIVAVAATPSGWGGKDLVFQMRSSVMKARVRLAALPAANGDEVCVGFWNDANNYVRFRSTKAGGAWPKYTVEIYSGGVKVIDAVLTGATALPTAATWQTFKVTTTATGAVFVFNEGESDEESVPLVGAPPNVRCDARATMRSAAGGEHHYTDYIRCHSTVAYK